MNLGRILRTELPICIVSNVTYIDLDLRLTFIIALTVEATCSRHMKSTSPRRHPSALMCPIKYDLILQFFGYFVVSLQGLSASMPLNFM